MGWMEVEVDHLLYMAEKVMRNAESPLTDVLKLNLVIIARLTVFCYGQRDVSIQIAFHHKGSTTTPTNM